MNSSHQVVIEVSSVWRGFKLTITTTRQLEQRFGAYR